MFFVLMEEDNLIFGTRAVIEALDAGKDIEKIFIQKGLSNELYHQLRNALKGQAVPIQIVPAEKLKRITDKNHQGVVAYLTQITYYSAEDLLATVFEKGRIPLILILDRVTDVRNLGPSPAVLSVQGLILSLFRAEVRHKLTAMPLKQVPAPCIV